MKNYLIIFTIFLSIQPLAQITWADQNTQGSAPCIDCGEQSTTLGASKAKQDAEEILNKIEGGNPFQCDKSNNANCTLINWLKMKEKTYAKNCQGFFLDESGKLGSFSKITTELMFNDIRKNNENSIFAKNIDDFKKYCPNYNSFSIAQKVAFHGWIFELTAFPESTCEVNIKPNNSAPTTKAVCMYQLEDKPSFRIWRSAGFDVKHCAVSESEILTVAGCTSCAFDEYKRKTLKDGTPFGQLDASGKKIHGAYWASHNPLAKADEDCMLKNLAINKSTNKPLWRTVCKNSNAEWMPRYKFFKRIQRFPLCNTDLAREELAKLNEFSNTEK